MRQRSLNAAIGVAAISLLLAGCGLSVGDGFAGSYARLGPAESPVQLYYEDVGAGPPVLLIHGFGASTYTWRHITPELARDHRVIAVDLKGFGQSDKPFDERYSVFDQADLLAQFIEEHDLRDLTVVGHSYGGGIALLLALEANQRLGNRIAKLVLLDTIAYPQNVPVFFRMLGTPLISHLGVRMVPPSVQTRVALQIAYLDNNKIEDSEVEVYAAPLKTAAGKHAIIHSARQIMPEDLEQISERYRVHRAADAHPVVRPRPHRADRCGFEVEAHATELEPEAGPGLRAHAAGGAARADAEAAQGLYRRLSFSGHLIGGRREGFTSTPAIRCHQACKPGSVPAPCDAAMAIHLGRPLPGASCNQPGRLIWKGLAGLPAAPPLFGFAPGGVCRAVFVAKDAVRSYRTLSPLPHAFVSEDAGRFAFCGTVPGVTPAGYYPAPSSMEPGLSSPPADTLALAERPSGLLTGVIRGFGRLASSH